MSINPYDSPSTLASAIDGDAANLPVTRPIGVAILAVLHLLGSLAFGGLMVFLAASSSQSPFDTRFPPTSVVVLVGGVCTLLGLACGTGMWTGAKFAWWLAAFYYVSMFLGEAIQAFVVTPLRSGVLDQEQFIVRLGSHSIRAGIFLLLSLYLFKLNVRRFFGLQSMSWLKGLGILLAAWFALVVTIGLLLFVIFLVARATGIGPT